MRNFTRFCLAIFWIVAPLAAIKIPCANNAVAGDPAAAKEKHRFVFKEVFIFRLAFSPNGEMLASGGHRGSVVVWDTASGREKFRSEVAHNSVNGLVFDPTGDYLAAAFSDLKSAGLKTWRVSTGREVSSYKGPEPAILLADANWAATTDGGKLQVRDTKDFKVTRGFDSVIKWSTLNYSALAPDGKIVALASAADNAIRLLDVDTGKEIRLLTGPKEGATRTWFSPSGKQLAATCRDDSVWIWDVQNGQATSNFPFTKRPTCLAFSSDERWLAFGFAGKSEPIMIRDLKAGKWALTVPTEGVTTHCVAFNSTGNMLAAGTGSAVQVWELPLKAK